MKEINNKSIRVWSMLGMRRVMGILLKDLADKDDKFIFTTADLGRYFGIDDLKRQNPEKVIDVGIAEQNLIGVSAGLCSEGFHVWAGTYATFITARALDQIRVNIGLMNYGIKMIGAAGGVSDGNFSATHMALEDIANMRIIPNMTVVVPADGLELVKAVEALEKYPGAAYIRLTGRAGTPIIYKSDYNYEIGKAIRIKDGTDIALISAGTILGTVLQVADELEKDGVSTSVIDMHTIKPLDINMLDELSTVKMVVTIEEHMKFGGLGASIAEYYSEKKEHPILKIIGIEDYYPEAMEYENILESCLLTKDKILFQILNKYNDLLKKGENNE